MMVKFRRKTGVRQTYWGPTSKIQVSAEWFADICVDVDEEIIEKAKIVVDACRPQSLSTIRGSFYYSFLIREFLLNQLLYGYVELGHIPSGLLHIAGESNVQLTDSMGYSLAWKAQKKEGYYCLPSLTVIPTVDEAIEKLRQEQAGGRATRTARATQSHPTDVYLGLSVNRSE